MKKLLLITAILFTLSAQAEEYLQLPDPDIEVRGYIIKDTKVVEGITMRRYLYELPELPTNSYWSSYKVCLHTTSANIDWTSGIYYPLDELPRVQLAAFVGKIPAIVKSWKETCSPLIKLNGGTNIKVALQNFKYTDTINKLTIKIFNTTNNLN